MRQRKASGGIRKSTRTKGNSRVENRCLDVVNPDLPLPSNNDVIGNADVPSQIKRPKFVRKAIDWGTAYTGVACQIFDADGQASDSDIYTVKLSLKEPEVDSVMAYDASGVLHGGTELLLLLDGNDGAWTEKDVLRNVKSALKHHSSGTSDASYEKVKEHCARVGKSIEDLVTDYLSLIVRQSFEWMSRNSPHYGDMSDIPFELILTTPTSWPPEYNILLMEAGMRAGASKCWSAQEAICCAVSALSQEIKHDQGRNLTQGLQPNDLVMVCDKGGGTCDVSLIRLLQTTSAADFRIELVRPLTGNSAGAEMVNQEFRTWLKTSYFGSYSGEDLEAVSASLGFSNSNDFLDRCAVKFEDCKRRFQEEYETGYSFCVHGMPSASRDVWYPRKKMNRAQMRSFFEPVIRAIEDLIRSSADGIVDLQTPGSLKMMIPCGGFSSSDYVVKRLRRTFPAVNILEPRVDYQAPVPTGALRRYSKNIQQPLGSCWSLLTTRDEPWSAKHHPDATVGRKPKPGVVFVSMYDRKTKLVYDRCNYFVDGVNRTVRLVWLDNVLDWHGDHEPLILEYKVFWTTKPDIRDSEPLLVDDTTDVRNEFFAFHTIRKTIHDPLAAGVRKEYHPETGRTTWRLITCLVPRFNQDNIELCILWDDSEKVFDRLDSPFDIYEPPPTEPDEEWHRIYNPDCSQLSQEFASSAPKRTLAQSAVPVNEPSYLHITNELSFGGAKHGSAYDAGSSSTRLYHRRVLDNNTG